jgi:hypothetical protein
MRAMQRVLKGLLIGISMLGWSMQTHAGEGPVFELRTYTVHEGRLPALESRFRDHTMRIFEKHGMRNVGYWIPVDTPNTLIYIIAHENGDPAANWQAFVSDPEWQAVYRDSRKDGPILVEDGIVSQFMTAADYSPVQ